MFSRVLRGHASGVYSLSVFPDGVVVSDSHDSTIVVWKESVAVGKVLKGHSQQVFSISCAADNKMIVSGSSDHTVRVWDRDQETSLKTLNAGCVVHSVIIANNMTIIAAFSNWKKIVIWSKGNYDGTPSVLSGEDANISCLNCMTMMADDDTLVVGTHQQTTCTWSISKLTRLQKMEGHTNQVCSISIFPDGRIITTSYDATMRIWNHTNGFCVAVINTSGVVYKSVLCVDNQTVVCGGLIVCKVDVWDLLEENITATFVGHTHAVSCLVLSNDGALLSASFDSTIRNWGILFPRLDTSILVYHACVWLAMFNIALQ